MLQKGAGGRAASAGSRLARFPAPLSTQHTSTPHCPFLFVGFIFMLRNRKEKEKKFFRLQKHFLANIKPRV